MGQKPASGAYLDARLISEQEVAGSTPAGSATLFYEYIFYGQSIPSADSRRTVFSFLRKNMPFCFWFLADTPVCNMQWTCPNSKLEKASFRNLEGNGITKRF